MSDNHAIDRRDAADASDPLFAKALELVRFWRDPATRALPSFLVLGGAGFLGLAFGWRAAARTLAVPLQIPAVVSGGIGGFMLVAAACLLASIHFSRGDAARERREIDELIEEARLLLEVAPKLVAKPTARRRRSAS
jgi:hypothetical protein